MDAIRPEPIGMAVRTSESLTIMRITFSRLVAALSLSIGGAITGFTGFGLVVADGVVRSGRVAVLPVDARMVHDLAVVAPVVGVLGLVAFVGGIALFVVSHQARTLGTVVSLAGTIVGLGLIALVLSAAGPFASMSSDRVVDGLGIVGSYAASNVVALVALVVDRVTAPAAPAMSGSAA